MIHLSKQELLSEVNKVIELMRPFSINRIKFWAKEYIIINYKSENHNYECDIILDKSGQHGCQKIVKDLNQYSNTDFTLDDIPSIKSFLNSNQFELRKNDKR